MTSMATSSPARGHSTGRAARAVLLVLLGLALCASASAKESDRSKNVNVNGVSLDATLQPNGVSHIKDAVITQGTLKITGDLATIYLDNQTAVKRVVLTGKAHVQQLDDNGNLMTGNADSIDYGVQNGIAILTGHAHVKQAGRGSASGDKIVYDTRTSAMTGQSSGDRRVHLTFKARNKPTAAPKTPAPAGQPAISSSTPAPAANTPGN
jgi:lipopolysaccharide export system protein LptA